MQTNPVEFEFRSVFSLKPLIDFWNRTIAGSANGWRPLVEGVQAKLALAPELHNPVEDLSILAPHEDLLKTLMSVVFPIAYWDTEAVGALVPFSLEPILVSPAFRRLFFTEDGQFGGRLHPEQQDFHRVRLTRCCLLILQKCYGIDSQVDFPLLRIVPDPDTGLDRYFKLKPDFRFVDVRAVGPLKQLTDQERATIMGHLAEPEVILDILPPDNFEIQGFCAVQGVEVTTSAVISALERDLIARDSFVSIEGFSRLQERLRTLLRRPELYAGLAAIQGDQIYMLNKGCEMACSCIFSDSRHVSVEEFKGSVFDRAVRSRQILTIRDITEEPNRTKVEEEIIQYGVRSMLIAPLLYQGELIGTLDLGSPYPGDFGPGEAMTLNQILPLFAVALRRSLDDLNNNVERIIKEQCTAVHPSVEWRFRKAVLRHLEESSKGRSSELEPIVFRDVFALYGASDIRGSSEARNRAIQADITDHLSLARNVVSLAQSAKPLHILNELTYRIDRSLDRIQKGLSTGDEVTALNFLREELEPLFPLLREYGSGVSDAVEAYTGALDSNLGTVYRQRRDFERSVSELNQRISAYLDREEAEAQGVFPHYFNKHQTDGVDYLIYLGSSMVDNGAFNELYVRNLRLWQLVVACGIAWHVEDLKRDGAVSLDATHLILVNRSPVSIRFRFDEKRFDVDGAYDIAHEIIRSRIDKARVKNRDERLTQPGQIAVVYSRPDESQEMSRHINFLQNQGYLRDEVESLELDDLPGVQGLKALRVGVNVESAALAEIAARS
jgi:hypothetical protein